MPDFSKIRYVVLDVDGTLTDGGIYYDSEGNESKRFDVRDGLGIKAGIAAGLTMVILTGRTSPMVVRRAKELGIHQVISGAKIKYPHLKRWMDQNDISTDEICYIGDDWNDLECMKAAAVCMCPADAAEEVKMISDYTASTSGGHGAVRDCMQVILKDMLKWEVACEQLYFSKGG